MAAGLVRRLLARLVDLVLVLGLPPLVVGGGVLVARSAGLPPLVVLVPGLLVAAGWLLPGWPLLERAALARFGRTPGKALLGVEVRAADGGPIVPSEASVRSVVILMPTVLLPALGFMVGLGPASVALPVAFGIALAVDALRTPDRRTAADRAAGTVVVRRGTLSLEVRPTAERTVERPLLPA